MATLSGNSNVARARKRITRLARTMGYLVTRDENEEEGVVTLTLFRLCYPPRIHLVEIVPAGTPDDPFLRERVLSSGLPIVPDRITPSEVQRVLDVLVEIERSIA